MHISYFLYTICISALKTTVYAVLRFITIITFGIKIVNKKLLGINIFTHEKTVHKYEVLSYKCTVKILHQSHSCPYICFKQLCAALYAKPCAVKRYIVVPAVTPLIGAVVVVVSLSCAVALLYHKLRLGA